MDIGRVTTPFGRRTMTLGLLASQAIARDIAPETCVDKWKLYRSLCEGRSRLGVSDRSLAVLNALISFYPKTELCAEDPLVVFPSNAQLSLRTHGMAEATLRRHLAALVEAGLILRRDSPNGKRYARKSGQGGIREAFGFCLSPLLARAEEIIQHAADVAAERRQLQTLRERVTLLRRDIVKLIATGREEQLSGDWDAYEAVYRTVLDALPRVPLNDHLTAALTGLQHLRADIINRLEQQIKSREVTGNASQNERHIQNSNTESHKDSEASISHDDEKRHLSAPEERSGIPQTEYQDDRPEPLISQETHKSPHSSETYPLALVLQACPEITPFGPGGGIRSWEDLSSAAAVIRSMLGVQPDAYQQACKVLGPKNAAAVMACILERSEHIRSAGGYLRNLTHRAYRNQFSPGPMLRALARAQSQREAQAA